MAEIVWWLWQLATAGIAAIAIGIGLAALLKRRRQARAERARSERNAHIEAANAERAAAYRAAMLNRTRCSGCGLPRQLGDDGVCRICQYRTALQAYRAQAPLCVKCSQPIPIDSQTHYCGRCLASMLQASTALQLPAPEFAEVDALLKRSGLYELLERSGL